MVKKGLSLEQKREKVLEIFHESDEVYQLKEIEKKAAARGVVAQSVKEVVQSLVDDDLVHQVMFALSLRAKYLFVTDVRWFAAISGLVHCLVRQGQVRVCRAMPCKVPFLGFFVKLPFSSFFVKHHVEHNLPVQEKIGIANFLWSFAAEASTKVLNEEARVRKAVTAAKVRSSYLLQGVTDSRETALLLLVGNAPPYRGT